METKKTDYLTLLNANALRDAEMYKGPACEADPLDDGWIPVAEPMFVGLYHGTRHEIETKAAAYMGTDPQNITLVDLNDSKDIAGLFKDGYDRKDNICRIVAADKNSLDDEPLVIAIRILSNDEDFNVIKAVRAACAEYVKTSDGSETLRANSGRFNWDDFESEVPNDICREHGFEKVQDAQFYIGVNLGEQMVENSDEKQKQEFAAW